MPEALQRDFFQGDFLEVARQLIGTTLSWDGCGGTVIETEAYGIDDDPACHTSFRPSSRRFFDEHPAGTCYVYLNYGVYWLLNVLVKGGPGPDGIILLRALEPTIGLPVMRSRRGHRSDRELCSGPGKLGVALGLSGRDHGSSCVCTADRRFLACGPAAPRVATDLRVGISRGTELPWRFLAAGHPGVSVPQGKA